MISSLIFGIRGALTTLHSGLGQGNPGLAFFRCCKLVLDPEPAGLIVLEVDALLPAVQPCTRAFGAVLRPPVPAHGRVEVCLAQLQPSGGSPVALLISFGCLAIHEGHRTCASFQVLVLHSVLHVLQLICSPPLGERQAAYRSHVLEVTINIDKVAVRLPAIAEDEAFDSAWLQWPLPLSFRTHPGQVDKHVLAERD